MFKKKQLKQDQGYLFANCHLSSPDRSSSTLQACTAASSSKMLPWEELKTLVEISGLSKKEHLHGVLKGAIRLACLS